ncbi:unnamed protein product [Diatraea saccharalis]|uniref:C2H2-type domain-containing protein n=1 Tax=Diatraea saccharalis TaxID=40085 RepID=A0A9N9R6N3_9NEOP|nr:unnamed protein product [Diatraea saccharalis]
MDSVEGNNNGYSGISSEEMATVKEEPSADDPLSETAELSSSAFVTAVRADIQRNRIILGSKPCPKIMIKPLFVSLEDWGDRLDRSSRYCKQCMILFVTRNDLDIHKMSAHSLLVPMHIPKDDPPNRNSNPKSDDVNIPRKKSACVYLACAICSCYFKSENEYYRHCNLMHKAYRDPNVVTSSPDSPVKCKYCGRTTKSPALHNKHIQGIHQSVYSKLGDNEQNINKISKKTALKRKNIGYPEPKAKKKTPVSTPPLKEIHQVPNKQQIKIKIDELYYCNVCKSFMRNLRDRVDHLLKKCRTIKSEYFCVTCGLKFSCSEQLKFHEEQHTESNISFDDFIFVCIRTLKSCNPPLPEFKKCITCKVHYINNHISCSNTPSKSCDLCKKIFTSEAHPLHLIHHNAMNATPPWNILYKCKVCDVITDSYDNVIEHCQKHLNKMEDCDVTVHTCEMCNLNFEEKCYKHHMESHENQTIDRNSLTFLSYDYLCMLTDDWLKVFDPLPKEQMRQILRHSIYVTSTVKMTVLQDGPPRFTIYKCLSCTKFVDGEDVSDHTALNKCKEKSSSEGHKCIICNFIFASQKAQMNHAFIHDSTDPVTANTFRIVTFNHPQDANYNAVLRSSCKMKNISERMSKIASGYRFIYYRCEKCYCCVKSKAAGKKNHVCVSEENMRLCHKCNFVFPKTDFRMHYHQRHVMINMTSDDVLIQPFNDNIKPDEWRVSLSECSKCGLKFPAHLLHKHKCNKMEENKNSDKNRIKKPDSAQTMTLCKISKKTALKRKNIGYPEPKAKKKTPVSTPPLKEIQQVPNKQQIKIKIDELYYCNVCKSFMRNLRDRVDHLLKKCRTIKSEYFCVTCGLKFSCSEQLKFHEEQHTESNISFDDFTFVCIRTLKSCNPPLPEFKKCITCKVHYINNHISCSNTPSKTCDLCKKIFTSEAHPLHLIHHNAMNATPPWNILYKCKVCDVITDSYDNVIEHCQKHLNKMEDCDVTVHTCELCNLNFEEKCYEHHMESHENQTIDRNSLTFLSYDYLCMLTDDWLKVLDPLPKEQMRQILRHSIYVTPTVKMTVLQDGPPRFTIYKCLRCTKFVDSEDVSNHTALNKCKEKSNSEGHKCIICNFIFASQKAQINHAFIHDSMDPVTANTFRIVTFNHPQDANYNAVLRSSCKMKNISKRTFKIASGYRFIYYRCEKCYCCVKSKAAGKKNHVCVSEENMRLCHKCNFVFPKTGYRMHYHQRHVMINMTSDDVLIQPFNDNIKPDEWRVSLSECSKCGLKFPAHLLHKHKCNKKEENKNSDKNRIEKPDSAQTMTLCRCPSYKAVFPKNMLAKHKKDCVFYKTKDKADSGETQKELIYKCNECDVYMLSGQDVRNHQKLNHKHPITRRCSICGWRFSIRSYHKHVSLHHRILKLIRKDFCVVEFDHEKPPIETSIENNHNIPRNTNKGVENIEDAGDLEDNECNRNNENRNINSDEKKICAAYASVDKKYGHYKNTLFRCAKCDIHYSSIRSWIHHIQSNHKVVVYVVCPTCGFKFTKKSLEKHLLSHETLEICNVITPEETHIVPHEWKLPKRLDDNEITTYTNDSVVSQSVNQDKATETELEQTTAPDDKTAPELHETLTLFNEPSPQKTYTQKIYKCKECNVYFTSERDCYNHIIRHVPIDPKECIECKFCKLPFKIMELDVHLKKHHNKDFELDEVIVEEYSNVGGELSKIEIYYAIDTVQSKLVSTTCDELASTAVMDIATSRTPDDAVSTSIEEYNVNNEERAKHKSTKPNDGEIVDIKIKLENDAKKEHKCRFCDEIFNSNTSKEFHESLDHLDVEKACEICKLSFNTSILNELHLNIRNDTFQCCLCRETLDLRDMSEHANMHFIKK